MVASAWATAEFMDSIVSYWIGFLVLKSRTELHAPSLERSERSSIGQDRHFISLYDLVRLQKFAFKGLATTHLTHIPRNGAMHDKKRTTIIVLSLNPFSFTAVLCIVQYLAIGDLVR